MTDPSNTDQQRVYRHALTWVVLFGLSALLFLRLPPMIAKQDSVLHTYADLVEVDAVARREYVEAIDDDRLVQGAIRGMMLRLDPYSGYISAQELPAFERRSEGDSVGVGIEVGLRDGRPTVIAPIEGSPAAEANVRPDDLILAVDEHSVDGRSVFEIEESLVGEFDTRVSLRLLSPGDRKPRTVSLQRRHVRTQTVRGFRRTPTGAWDYLIDPALAIGYIRVSNFRLNTITDFNAALAELRAAKFRALVLDLRFNPGGLMQQGIAMADRFLSDGLILCTTTRRGVVDEYCAHDEDFNTDGVALVVLINGSTASAAEIVAGSLQARCRAVIVGERSFGKGSVQHVIHLADQGAAMKLTVAYYCLPDMRSIHRTPKNASTLGWGIHPDVLVELSADETQSLQASRRAVNFGSRQREGEDSDPPTPAESTTDAGADVELVRDRQLVRALELLREGGGRIGSIRLGCGPDILPFRTRAEKP